MSAVADCMCGFKAPHGRVLCMLLPLLRCLRYYRGVQETDVIKSYSPGIAQISADFGVGREVGTLGLTLLLFGFGIGPLIWAPLSEVYGRKPAVLVPYFIAAIFSFGTAAAKDIQTVMLTRFFAGVFGSAPITNTGGVLSDIWSAEERGAAIVGYALAVVGGPVLGPIVGGAIVQSYLRWRWTEYVSSPIHYMSVAY